MTEGSLSPARLAKFLGSAPVRGLLDRTLPLLPPGSRLEVVVHGQDQTVPDRPGPPAAPVRLDLCLGGLSASLCAWLPDGPNGTDGPGDSAGLSDRATAARVLDLAGASLGALVELEAARRSLGAEALGKYRELADLDKAIRAFNKTLRLRGITEALVEDCRRDDIPAESGVLFLRRSGDAAYERFGSFGPAEDMGLVRAAETSLFEDATAQGGGEIVNDLSGDARWGVPGPRPGALLIHPVVSPNLCLGAVVLGTAGAGRFTSAHLRRLATICSVAAVAIENAFNFEEVQRLMDALLKALAAAIDSRDRFTSGHSERVARLGVALAQAVNRQAGSADAPFSEQALRELFYAGILHDVGKIGVREQVLTKNTRLPQTHLDAIGLRLEHRGRLLGEPWEADFDRLCEINRSFRLTWEDLHLLDRLVRTRFSLGGADRPLLTEAEYECLRIPLGNLTPEERLEIQRHPAESLRILRHIPFPDKFKSLMTIIAQHHERLDGSGYPAGERGDLILPQSRIMAIVDTFDAVTQQRHYKQALPREKALAVLAHEAAAGRLDSGLVDLFSRDIEEIERAAASLDIKL